MNSSQLGSIGEAVTQIEAWNDWLIIRGESNRLWTSYQNQRPKIWKEDRDAGNYITVTKNDLWLCEYDKVSKIISSQNSGSSASATTSSTNNSADIQLTDIGNQVIPHSKPLLLPIEDKCCRSEYGAIFISVAGYHQCRNQGTKLLLGTHIQ
ncbi:MAG: hypothetical protein U5J63_11680 [Fodinibius sp.]|nr:hypothetical protein [Fodinibius sp.]